MRYLLKNLIIFQVKKGDFNMPIVLTGGSLSAVDYMDKIKANGGLVTEEVKGIVQAAEAAKEAAQDEALAQ